VLIYLDHAASTPMRPEAIAAMQPFLADHPGNPSGSHAAARATKTAIEEAREIVADSCATDAHNVVFTAGGSEADNLAVKGIAWYAREHSNLDGVVTTGIEHKAVLGAAGRLAREGFRVATVGANLDGRVDLDQLAESLDERTALVSVMCVNNETGIVQPLDEIAAIVHERAPNASLHTDAVQAPQWLAMDLSVDLISISGHKFGGPKGAGALIVRDDLPLVPLIEGGGHERERRAGTQAVPSVVALGAALREVEQNRSSERARIGALRDRFEQGIRDKLPSVEVTGDVSHRVEGVSHVAFPGVESETLLVALDQRGVCAASGSACSSGSVDPSHVLLAMGMSREHALSCVRFSFGYASTDDDVDQAIPIVVEEAARLGCS
jgi:cysteine desulfurase